MFCTTDHIRLRLSGIIAVALIASAIPAASADEGHRHGSGQSPASHQVQNKGESHMGDGHDHGGKIIGEPGKASAVTRTVSIRLTDNRYEPESIQVKAGETIRFVVTNAGEFLHEFNIGTAAMHAEHQKEMAMMAEHGMITATGINHEMMKMDHAKVGMKPMKHDDPNSVLLAPGEKKDLIWKFTAAIDLEFACNVPGHYESGMVGKIQFQR